jgi:cytidylate kinase
MTDTIPVLALDGPSGSGKGTVGQILARRLGWHFLDSGALYRSLGIAAEQTGVDLDNKSALARLALEMSLRFTPRESADTVDVLLNGQEIGDRLRTEASGSRASILAAIPEVRRALLQKQHSFRQAPGLVADGRDMGSTVFPDAILKVYLTATPELRAERRYKQLKDKGFDVNLRELFNEIRERDARDAVREVSPLKPATDACVLDTSQLDISGVVERVYGLLQARQRRG